MSDSSAEAHEWHRIIRASVREWRWRVLKLTELNRATTVLLASVASVVLGGTNQYGMKNPRTDQIIICRAEAGQAGNPWLNAERCAEALKRDGWVELGRD